MANRIIIILHDEPLHCMAALITNKIRGDQKVHKKEIYQQKEDGYEEID